MPWVGWSRPTRLVPTWPALGQPVSTSADSHGDRPVPPQHSPGQAPPGGPFPFRFRGHSSHYPEGPSAFVLGDALFCAAHQRWLCSPLVGGGVASAVYPLFSLAEACNISVCACCLNGATLLRRLGAAARRGLSKWAASAVTGGSRAGTRLPPRPERSKFCYCAARPARPLRSAGAAQQPAPKWMYRRRCCG